MTSSLRAVVAISLAILVAALAAAYLRDEGDHAAADRPGGTAETAKTAPPDIEAYVDVGDVPRGGRPRPRSEWARDFFEQASATESDVGPYREGSSPRFRPFDDSDPEMQALVGRAYAVGGCAQPGRPCKPALDVFRSGGDRLAAYLIEQHRRAERGGYPNLRTGLDLIAYTKSQTGFEFIRDRVANSSGMPIEDRRWAVRSLSKTGHPDAIDIALELVDDPDRGVMTSAMNTLWRVSVDTGVLRDDVKAVILDRHARGWTIARYAVIELSKHFDMGLEEETPLEP